MNNRKPGISRRTALALGGAAMATTALPGLARAAGEWPTRPIKIIVPYPPGGSGDNNARPFADKLSQILGQQLVIENRGGAGGAVGAEAAAKSAPDGYTFMFTPTPPLLIRPHTFKVPYDVFRDFETVSLMTESVAVLAVHPSVGAKTLKDFIEIAKKDPGGIPFAAVGLGGITHLRIAYLEQLAGIRLTAVPYAGAGPAMNDLVAGHVKALFEPATAPAVKAGQLVGMGILDTERSPDMPNVPTMDEAAKAAGLPGFHIPSWQAAFAPKGTPKEIVTRMSSAIGEAGKDPQVIERTRITSLRVVTTSPEEMLSLLRKNYDQYGELIKKAGIKMQE